MSGTKQRARGVATTSKPVKTVDRKAPYSDAVDGLQGMLPGIPDRPTKGLMTFAELQAKFVSVPKEDRLGGLWKMSVRYKDIGNKLDTARAMLDGVTLGQVSTKDGRAAFEQDLNGALDDVVTAGKAYLKKHKGTKGGIIQGLIDQAEQVRATIGPTLDDLLDGVADDLPGDLHIDQAVAAKRLGIKPAQLRGVSAKHCNFADINDEKADAPPAVLGKGAVNTVHSIVHGGVERVFKEEQQQDKSGANAPMFMGIDSINDPRYGNRNVASGAIGKLLDTKVMPQSSFGVSGGKVGLVMDKAPGETLQKMLRDKTIDARSFSTKAMASLQRQLADMEACDIIAGQSDRHCGNYLIDINGDNVTVTAIDNDFAFPDMDKALGNKSKVPLNFMGMNSIKSLPALLDAKIAAKIKAINFDRDMRPEFEGALTENEIDAAATRMQAMQDHVRELERTGCIVSNWETWRLPPNNTTNATDYLGGDGKGSLFGRDLGKALDLR